MVSDLTGVGAGQQVALVSRVHDEAATLCSATKGADVRVGEHVAERGANLEQTTVLVLVAGAADPFVKSGLNAVEFQRHHFGTGTKGLADSG